MARGPKKIAAFSSYEYIVILDNLQELVGKAASLYRTGMTAEEAFSAFTHPEHRGPLRAVHGIVTTAHTDIRFPYGLMAASLRFSTRYAREAYVFPAYAGTNKFEPDTPRELLDRIDQWLGARIALSLRARHTFYVVQSLQNICTNPMQVRILLPGVLFLLDAVAREALQERKTPKDMPAITPQFRAAIEEANTFLCMLNLIRDNEAPPEDGVPVSLIHYDTPERPDWWCRGEETFNPPMYT